MPRTTHIKLRQALGLLVILVLVAVRLHRELPALASIGF